MDLKRKVLAAIVLAIGLVACSDHREAERSASAPAADEANVVEAPAEAMLAYEHDVRVVLDADAIDARVQALQDACTEGRHGECTILSAGRRGGDSPQGRVVMRVVPEGVGPLIRIAGEGGKIGNRRVHAEDLTVAVRDNRLMIERLKKEHSQLLGFQERPDLAVADMIALSKQIAEVEAQLQTAQREAAQHERRINTQKLSIQLDPPPGQSGRSEVGEAIRDFGAIMAVATAWTIRVVAALIPAAVLVLLLIWAIRDWRRRRRSRS